jgi:predicted ATPase/DNA-binding CsgD family transcriptional regulator
MSTTGRHIVGNLPTEVSSFVGRRRESAEIKRLLTAARLVTMTGVGGVGKTRLALRVGADVRRAFPDGVWFVDLTALPAPGAPAQEVGYADEPAYLVLATLGLREHGAGPALRQLVDQLATRRLLLVLDNCEHLVPAAAVLVDALLRGCPDLRVLATSREPLTVGGEVVFTVPPLPTPDPRHLPSRDELARSEAVALFLARARAVAPGFDLTDDNEGAVAEVCHRLDGLPLAIELAAARIRVLAPQQILARLTDRFALLDRSRRAAPERQQTLQACVDWSFDLCDKYERLLWARLSVFAGGFELDAAQAVCADEDLPADDVLEPIFGLVEKSVLMFDDRADGARYRMLETIREFGRVRLRASGEEARLRRRHRDWCRQLVDRARSEYFSDRQVYWLGRLGREYPNLRVAMEYCLTEPGEAEAGLELAVTLPRTFWWARGLFGDGRRWLDQALVQTEATHALRARALALAAHFAMMQGDLEATSRWMAEGQATAATVGTPTELAHFAFYRAMAAMYRNDLTAAYDLHEEALALLAAAGDEDLGLRLAVLISLGTLAAMAGDDVRADTYVQEILAITAPRGEVYYRSLAQWLASLIAWHRGDVAAATDRAREGLRLRRSHGLRDQYGYVLCLEALAWVAAGRRQYRRAATLLGAADTVWRDLGTSITAHQHLVGDHDACWRETREALGEAAFEATFRRGRKLAFDAAVGYALEEAAPPGRIGPADPAGPLTKREREVAGLVAAGLTNKEIAGRLVISQRTAEGHVENILAKLNLTNRAQLVRWLAGQRHPGE